MTSFSLAFETMSLIINLKCIGFFEVFPELKFKWPVWARKKNGGAIECETDKDCLFPQACCNHPIIPGKKFCCTGYGQRIMEPAYIGQEIQGDVAMGRRVGESDLDEKDSKEPWRPNDRYATPSIGKWD